MYILGCVTNVLKLNKTGTIAGKNERKWNILHSIKYWKEDNDREEPNNHYSSYLGNSKESSKTKIPEQEEMENEGRQRKKKALCSKLRKWVVQE